MLIWVDGAPARSMPLPDRGVEFGDGLFETLLVADGRALYPDLHLQRLERGLRALGFPRCLRAVRSCLDIATSGIKQHHWAWASLRLTVTRGGGPRGYAPPASPRPRVLAQASALSRECRVLQAPAQLAQAAIRLPWQPALAGIKHLNRLEQVLAAQEGRRRGMDEVLMLDSSGALVGVAAGSLFLRRGNAVSTPVLDGCGVAGTRRELIIKRWAPAAGLTVTEARLTLDDLADADEVFYSNALYGLRPIAAVDSLVWSEHSACEALFQMFVGELA